MPLPSRTPSRLELQDPSSFQPRLRLEPELPAPGDTPPAARVQSRAAWQALRAAPEEVLRDREELERMDRALLTLRKQFHAARADAVAARTLASQAEAGRYAPATVGALGALAALATAGWLYERRRRVARQDAVDSLRFEAPPALTGLSQPAIDPPALSEFESTDLQVHGDEAEQWIQQARLAVPQVR